MADIGTRVAEIYGGPLDAFVTARDALARELRSAGDREAAAEVKALRKPRALAWGLNAARLDAPDAVTDLAGAAAAVGEAQSGGGDLRSALADLRAAERRVVDAAAGAAERHGQRLDPVALSGAVRAVIADPDALADLQAGRLVDTPDAGGLGLDFGSASGTVTHGERTKAGRGDGQAGTRARSKGSGAGGQDERAGGSRGAATAGRRGRSAERSTGGQAGGRGSRSAATAGGVGKRGPKRGAASAGSAATDVGAEAPVVDPAVVAAARRELLAAERALRSAVNSARRASSTADEVEARAAAARRKADDAVAAQAAAEERLALARQALDAVDPADR
jgi:hypothetical protein